MVMAGSMVKTNRFSLEVRPGEPVALGKDLEHSLAAQHGVRIEQVLLDAEDQVLFPQAGVVRDVELFRHRMQLRDGLLLQFGDIHGMGTPSVVREVEGGEPPTW